MRSGERIEQGLSVTDWEQSNEITHYLMNQPQLKIFIRIMLLEDYSSNIRYSSLKEGETKRTDSS